MMVGRELKDKYFSTRNRSEGTEEIVFEVKNLTTPDKKVKDVSFQLRRHEILGFSGLMGAAGLNC